MCSSLPSWASERRAKWNYKGDDRPDIATEPDHDQESVWDYPRPPKIDSVNQPVRVELANTSLAKTTKAVKILETSNPPSFYIPKKDVATDYLHESDYTSRCEWKGAAAYWDTEIDNLTVQKSAWSYPEPFPGYEDIANYISFYPQKVDCYVCGEHVKPQPEAGYGGWVTDNIVGPFSLPDN